MTVCECCEELCDGLGPYCNECTKDMEELTVSEDDLAPDSGEVRK